MSSKRISSVELSELLGSESAPVLLHVLSDEAFEEKRIPGSSHACVYEIAFLEKVAEWVKDKSARIVVYGLNDRFGAAALAGERLEGGGYENVEILVGGLDAWESAGQPTEGEGEDASLNRDGRYEVDTGQSVFRWTGRNLFNQHNGRIAIKSGELVMKGGWLDGGDIELDMTQISCSDLKDENLQKILIAHLENDDFFSVADYPVGSFSVREVKILAELGPGESNLEVTGTLSLRGVEKPIVFHAQQAYLGGKLGLQGQFEVDRTEFGSVYGSGKIFEKLGQHVVNDKITVGFQLISMTEAGED